MRIFQQTGHSTGEHAPLSGPHICSHVGRKTISIAKKTLLDTCDRSGGTLSRDEIEHVLDVLVDVPEMFALFSRSFDDCAHIHRDHGFAKVTDRRFAGLVLRAYCQDVIRQTFDRQIAAHGQAWTDHFADALVDHIENTANPAFVAELYERYRVLSMRDDADLCLSSLYDDAGLQDLIGEAVTALFHEDDGHHALESTINHQIASAMRVFGASDIGVSAHGLREFFRGLITHTDANAFRRSVNRRLTA